MAKSSVQSWRGLRWVICFAIIACLASLTAAVKHENFKTCAQSGFCTRNRAFADKAASTSNWETKFSLDPESLKPVGGMLQGTLYKDIGEAEPVKFPILFAFLSSGVVRVTVDEFKRQRQTITLRHGSKAKKERYNEAGNWALLSASLETVKELSMKTEDGKTIISYGPDNTFEAIITAKPFAIEFKRDGETQVKLNSKGLMNMEHWRAKKEPPAVPEGESSSETTESTKAEESAVPSVDESTWWEETFGGNTDSKPRGPESVSLDVSFPGYDTVYGIPSHASSLSLKETRGGSDQYTEPYRLYNADVFEYIIDSPMTLYGSIPFLQAHKKDSTVGVFWLNAAETWVDIVKHKSGGALGIGAKVDETQTHWMSESGQMDLFIFLGPTPKDVNKAYGALTGYTTLPQLFAIGHHQCRWNYISQDDVKSVDERMDEHEIPYDVIWLDIEYTDNKKYFTWDPLTFSDPKAMQEHLGAKGRKLVTIIDPHIKNEAGYEVDETLKIDGYAVKNKDGEIFEGWCWPGSSHWVDCFNPEARKWWKSLFYYEVFNGSTAHQFIWNDMNEPSVFNGPETTMPKDNLHYGNWEHRDLHNLNGMTFHHATYYGLVDRTPGELRRPFVLTRAFFAGSQRTAAMWTGDNQASWEHLAQAFPMLLSNGIAGFPFAGADVGGFFGNPEKDLLTRWYQAGAFYPFFRAHAHIDTRRREPYLIGEPYTEIITKALRLRYQLLPAWYTAFFEASDDGSPILRPMYYEFPGEEAAFAIDDQFFVGSTGLLAKPVVAAGAESVDIYLPGDEPYFDYFDYTTYTKSRSGTATVPAPLDKIPLLIRGGGIVPRRDRPRRNSHLMKQDPFTLLIAVDRAGQAEGQLYVDDGESFENHIGAFIHRKFMYESASASLSSTNAAQPSDREEAKKYLESMKDVRVEKIIIVNAGKGWSGKTTVDVSEAGGSTHTADVTVNEPKGKTARWVVIRDPKVAIMKDWKIDFSKSSSSVKEDL